MSRRAHTRGVIHAGAFTLVLLAVYTMLGFFLVPHLLERKFAEYAQHAGIDLSIGALGFNPFLLAIEGRDLRAALPDDAAFFGVAWFSVDLKAAASILRRTWTVSDAEAGGVHARLRIGAGMPDANSPAAPDAAAKAARLPPVILERVRVADAHVELLDGAGADAGRVVVGPIRMQAEGLSTVPDKHGRALLTSTLPQDGALAAAGEITLEPLAVRGSIELRGLQLESIAALALRGPRPILPPVGRLDAEFGFHAARTDGKTTFALQKMSAELGDFTIPRPDGEPPMLGFSSMALTGGEVDFIARSATLQRLDVQGVRFSLVRETDGRFDMERVWQAFVPHDRSPRTQAAPWHVQISRMAFGAIAAHYVDRAASRSPAIPARFDTGVIDARLAIASTIGPDATHVTVSGLELRIRDLAVHAVGVDAPLASVASLAITQGSLDTRQRLLDAERIHLQGLSGSVTRDRAGALRLTGSPAGNALAQAQQPAVSHRGSAGNSGPWSVRIGRVNGDAGELRFVDQSFAAPLKLVAANARFAFGLELTAARETQLMLIDMEAGASGISAQSTGTRGQVELGQVTLNRGRLDSVARRFAAESLAVRSGRIALSRDPDGSMRIGGLALDPWEAKNAPPRKVATPWNYDIGTVRIAGLQVAVADHSFTPAIAYRLAVDATLRELRDTSGTPMRFDATLAAASGGTVRLQGSATQDLRQASAQIRARELALAPLDPLLARFAHLRFASGSASADLRTEYRAEGAPRLAFQGNMGMSDVQLNDTGRDAQFAAWQSLAAERVRFTLSPDQLDIADVRIAGPQATLIVAKERTLNLPNLLKTKGKNSAGIRRERNVALPIRIGRVTFAQGRMQFADLSLVLPFSTRIHALDGVIVGLTTHPDGRAELQLDGKIENYGAARARGSLNAANPTEFMDISVAFDNVRIAPLSPYTATFAGRMIEAGRLWLDLDYRISNGRLSGENRIVLDDVELGKRIESPKAADLPLELALALLKDSEGRARFEIPVSGNVGDPKFDYGKVIRAAIGKTLQRIVTAPFRALAHLFGGRDTELVRKVEFEPGSHHLAPAEQEQLALLARALGKRPALDLIVFGPYDAALDDRALREHAVRESVAAALGRAPVSGDADPIAFGDPDTQRVLDALAAARLGSETRAQLNAADAAKGRSYYAVVFDALVAHTQLSSTELQLLAANRAKAITQELLQSGLDPGRVAGSQIGAVASSGPDTVEATLDLRPGSQ